MLTGTLGHIFSDVRYILLATLSALFVFVLSTWLPNLGLVWQISTSSSIALADKIDVLLSLIGSIGTNFTVFSALSTIAISVLFGVNMAMIAYYFGSRRQVLRRAGHAGAAASLGGVATGLFGVGCAACGAFVLSPILSFIGATGLITLLPFGGEEFGLLGVGMLIFSIVLTARKIREPAVCAIGRPDASAANQPTMDDFGAIASPKSNTTRNAIREGRSLFMIESEP